MPKGYGKSSPRESKATSGEPYRPFSSLIFRTGTSWPELLSLTIQTGHNSRECHIPMLPSHESASCHCIHRFSLLFFFSLSLSEDRQMTVDIGKAAIRKTHPTGPLPTVTGRIGRLQPLPSRPDWRKGTVFPLPEHSKPLTRGAWVDLLSTQSLPGHSHTRRTFELSCDITIPGYSNSIPGKKLESDQCISKSTLPCRYLGIRQMSVII